MDVEVKVLLAKEHWGKVKKRIPKDLDETKREIWFFETADLALKQQEIVLRARVHPKKETVESTTKWRRWVSPFVTVLRAWEPLPGFKAEVDASLTEGVPAWSMTAKDGQLDFFQAVTRGKKPVQALFNDYQRLLVESAWPQIPWKDLKPWGPIASLKWDLPKDLTIERWSIGDESIIEISKRGPNQIAALEEVRHWLSKADLELAALDGGKTAWALAQLIRPTP